MKSFYLIFENNAPMENDEFVKFLKRFDRYLRLMPHFIIVNSKTLTSVEIKDELISIMDTSEKVFVAQAEVNGYAAWDNFVESTCLDIINILNQN